MMKIFDTGGLSEAEAVCGVYLLFKDGAPVYIGRSVDIAKRIERHTKGVKDFDEVRYFECDKGTLEDTEKLMINLLTPKYNITIGAANYDKVKTIFVTEVKDVHVPYREVSDKVKEKFIDDVMVLSNRAQRALRVAGILTIGQLCSLSEDQIFGLTRVGLKTFGEIIDAINYIEG